MDEETDEKYRKEAIRKMYLGIVEFLKDALKNAQTEFDDIALTLKIRKNDDEIYQDFKKISDNARERIKLFRELIEKYKEFTWDVD